jgi:imidazolonepropionase-like amidohydrolase
MMLDKKIYFVPTMATAWAYKDMYPDLFSALKKAVKQLYEAGVSIAVGTDSGAPGVVIGKAVHKELETLVEAGLSPMEAIVCGTKKAAENLGQENEVGTIETGKLADMIAVSGNPAIDILDTRNIKLVVQDGRILINKLG